MKLPLHTILDIIFYSIAILFILFLTYVYFKNVKGFNFKNWFNYRFRKQKMISENLKILSQTPLHKNEKYFKIKGVNVPARSYKEADLLHKNILDLKVIYTKA